MQTGELSGIHDRQNAAAANSQYNSRDKNLDCSKI